MCAIGIRFAGFATRGFAWPHKKLPAWACTMTTTMPRRKDLGEACFTNAGIESGRCEGVCVDACSMSFGCQHGLQCESATLRSIRPGALPPPSPVPVGNGPLRFRMTSHRHTKQSQATPLPRTGQVKTSNALRLQCRISVLFMIHMVAAGVCAQARTRWPRRTSGRFVSRMRAACRTGARASAWTPSSVTPAA